MTTTVDVAVVGGGHNGQILAGYLSKAGLETLVLERRLEPGGGLCTEESIRPGFLHNLHAYFLRSIPDLPWYLDFDLASLGVKIICPPVQTVMPLLDGRALIFHRDLEKTIRSIARISEKDAARFKAFYPLAEAINRRVITPESYAPPLDFDRKKHLLEKSALGREYLAMCARSPLELAEDYFESEEMRAMMVFLLSTRMFLPDEAKLGFNFASVTVGSMSGTLCHGGSHYLAHGISKYVERNGGRIWETTPVREILVEGGRAVGVVLEDGRRVTARRAVVSAVGAPQTFLELLDDALLPSDVVDKALTYKFAKMVLFGGHFALNEALLYNAARFDPDVNRGYNYNIGLERVDDYFEHRRQVESGQPPDIPGMQCALPSLYDPVQAPAGRHTAFLWQPAPFDLEEGGPEAWDLVKNEYLQVCLDRWRQYAPNLNEKNIIATLIHTPLDVQRKLVDMRYGDHCEGLASADQMLDHRPFEGLKPYRTPVDRLYMCGSCTHPFGNITGAPGYNAAQVIARDLGLDLWWKPHDLDRLWAGLR